MIGNDIVDLSLAKLQSNWTRKGYLEKIFTQNELRFIADNYNDKTIWNLWSRKEAVYKIYNRTFNIRAFIPKKIECLDYSDNQIYGKVKLFDLVYHTKTIKKNDFIYTNAATSKKKLNKIKDLFFETYNDYLNNNFIYKNQNNLPYIIEKDKERAVSITHHGKYCVLCY